MELYFIKHTGEAARWVHAFQFAALLSMETLSLTKTSRNNEESGGRVNAVARS